MISVITITGIGDHLQPEWLITFTGMRSMRYIDPMFAAYVGETVLLRYDPRDVGEVWLFHQERGFSAAPRLSRTDGPDSCPA